MDGRRRSLASGTSRAIIEKEKLPRLSIPVSGVSDVTSNDQVSSDVRLGEKGRPISSNSDSRTQLAGVQNSALESDLAWYQIITVLRRVRESRKVSGTEFNILNLWGCAVIIILHGLVFSTLAYFSIKHTLLFTPTSEKKLAIWSAIGSVLLLVAELVITSGYLLTRLDHPLVRSRGSVYITMVSLGVFGTCVTLPITTFIYIGVIRTPPGIISVVAAISISCTILLLGALAARQRLVYLLFEVEVGISRNIYLHTYIAVILWALSVGGVIIALGHIDFVKYRMATYIVVNIGCYVVLVVLSYYSYKSRNIKVAFSDWRSNLVVSCLCTGVTTFLTLLSAFWLDPLTMFTPEWMKAHIATTFIICYSMFFAGCVCLVFLFGQIAFIVFCDLGTAADLNPATTFDHHVPPGSFDQYAPANRVRAHTHNGNSSNASNATIIGASSISNATIITAVDASSTSYFGTLGASHASIIGAPGACASNATYIDTLDASDAANIGSSAPMVSTVDPIPAPAQQS